MSRTSRIILTPVLLGFALLLPFIPEWTFARAVLVAGLMATSLALLLGMWNPVRFWWALRLVAASVFFSYAAYFVSEFLFTGRPRNWDALKGLLHLGIPALIYVFTGKGTILALFGAPEPEASEAELAEELAEDEAEESGPH
jgi:hypothetical protein